MENPCKILNRVENIVTKGENFSLCKNLLLPQCFQKSPAEDASNLHLHVGKGLTGKYRKISNDFNALLRDVISQLTIFHYGLQLFNT